MKRKVFWPMCSGIIIKDFGLFDSHESFHSLKNKWILMFINAIRKYTYVISQTLLDNNNFFTKSTLHWIMKRHDFQCLNILPFVFIHSLSDILASKLPLNNFELTFISKVRLQLLEWMILQISFCCY